MKESTKKFAKNQFDRFPWIKRFIYRLNNLANGSEDIGKGDTISNVVIKNKESDMFTSKALYSGYSIDYLNSKFLTKKERGNEK